MIKAFVVLALVICSVLSFSPACTKICVARHITSKSGIKDCYKQCKADLKKGRELLDTISADINEQTESDSEISTGASLQANTDANIRTGPCTTNSIVVTVKPGTQMTYDGSSQAGCGYTWYKVKGGFGNGWIANSLVNEVAQPTPGSSGSFSVATLQRVFPLLSASKAAEYYPHLLSAMNQAGITTCLRRSAFLAQVGHESGQLRWFEEFASGEAYEGRRDLGNTQPGDGRRYKGRGPIQITGRANYRSAGAALGVDFENNPTLASTPQWGFKIATWFWNSRGLSGYADKGTQDDFDIITKRINGGYNGKDDRDALYWNFRRQLGC